MRNDILKIYHFPIGKTKFVAICEGKRFYSWSSDSGIKIEDILSYTVSEPNLISCWQDEDWGQLVQECWDKKHEQHLVWSKEKKVNNLSCFWLVWCPGGTNPEYCNPSRTDAENEAKRLAKVYPGTEFYVFKAESMYCTKGVEQVKFYDDSEDLPS